MKLQKLLSSKNIREIRNKLGLSQEQFAQKIGVSFTSVNRWENSKTNPSPLAVEKIKSLVVSNK